MSDVDISKQIFNEFAVTKLNLIKTVFECLGEDLEESYPNVVYHNYMDAGLMDMPVTSKAFYGSLEGDFTGTMKVGVLTDGLKNLFIKYANLNNIDWKWLAALAWIESGWNAGAGNSMGYSYKGLFQFSAATIGKGRNVSKPEDQTAAAAENMGRQYRWAKNHGFSDTDAYLYAGISHNAGAGGAKWAYDRAGSSNINAIRQVLLSGYAQHCLSRANLSEQEQLRQNKEKSDYPVKLAKAYNSI